MTSRHAFGSRLRTQRERSGITLESIAESTKIKQSLLDALERGDASHWPRGLFRRAYLRSYASAIGVPPEPLVAEFVKLFPEDGAPVSDEMALSFAEPLRLTFAVEPDTWLKRAASRAASALAELSGVMALGLAGSLMSGWSMASACGLAALVYYPLSTALTGRVLSPALLRNLSRRAPRVMEPPVVSAPEPAPLYLVSRQPAAAAPPPLIVPVAADEFVQPRTAAR